MNNNNNIHVNPNFLPKPKNTHGTYTNNEYKIHEESYVNNNNKKIHVNPSFVKRLCTNDREIYPFRDYSDHYYVNEKLNFCSAYSKSVYKNTQDINTNLNTPVTLCSSIPYLSDSSRKHYASANTSSVMPCIISSSNGRSYANHMTCSLSGSSEYIYKAESIKGNDSITPVNNYHENQLSNMSKSKTCHLNPNFIKKESIQNQFSYNRNYVANPSGKSLVTQNKTDLCTNQILNRHKTCNSDSPYKISNFNITFPKPTDPFLIKNPRINCVSTKSNTDVRNITVINKENTQHLINGNILQGVGNTVRKLSEVLITQNHSNGDLSSKKQSASNLSISPKNRKQCLVSPVNEEIPKKSTLGNPLINADVPYTKKEFNIVSRNKLVRRKSSSNLESSVALQHKLTSNCRKDRVSEHHLHNKGGSIRNKVYFAVKTRNKLIRRKSINSKYKKCNRSNVIKSTSSVNVGIPIKKGALLKAKENILYKRKVDSIKSTSPRLLPVKDRFLKSKYKIINKANTDVVLKYKLKRRARSVLSSTNVKVTQDSSTGNASLQKKRPLKKSDKFINIGGSLYKSTRMSLKKQDLTQKDKSAPHYIPNNMKRKTTFNRNSRFSLKRQKSDIQQYLQPGMLIEILRRKKLTLSVKTKEFCLFYNRFGKCNKRERGGCPFIHDPEKIAICTRFLRGSCTQSNCPFSHKLDKSKMPVCSHFLEGSCHRETCPYRHVRVNPKAPLCGSFLKGYCPHGEECKKKHILECEEFKENGVCSRGKNCFLSHKKGKPSLASSKKKRKISESTGSKRRERGQKSSGRKVMGKIGILGLVSSEKVVKSRQTAVARYFQSSEDVQQAVNSSINESPSKNSTELKLENIYENDGSRKVDSNENYDTRKVDSNENHTRKVESNENDDNRKVDSNENNLQQKRERLLKKLEKLKNTYTIGLENNETPSKSKDKLDKSTTSNTLITSKNVSTAVKEDASNFKPWSIPWPDSLPPYIPLSFTFEEKH